MGLRKPDPNQLALLDVPPRLTEQERQVKRVRGKIHLAILGFFHRRRPGDVFTAPELHRVIREKHPSLAPDSPGRIMRLLRAEGLINYRVVSRKDSLYEILRPEEI